MNKRGQGMWILIGIFGIMVILLILAFVFSITTGVVHNVSSTISPIASDLGVVNNVNLSDAGRITFGTANNVVGMLPMFVGGAYILLLVGCVGLCIAYRGTANKLFLGLYLAFMVLVVLIAFLVSNVYQDMYTGGDTLALELQSQTLLSNLILYSPGIFVAIGFVCGIFLFTGEDKSLNEFSGYNGYGGYP